MVLMMSVISVLMAVATPAKADRVAPPHRIQTIWTYQTKENAYALTQFGLQRQCQIFLKADGSLGLWGLGLVKAFERVGTDCFYKKINFSKLCPKYKQFSRVEKNRFLAFLWAMMSGVPVSQTPAPTFVFCSPGFHSSKSFDGGINAPADLHVGMMSLERSPAMRKVNRRNPIFCPNVPAQKMTEMKYQLECSASMFSDYYCSGKKVPGRDPGYWLSLREFTHQKPYLGVIQRPKKAMPLKKISDFPGCK